MNVQDWAPVVIHGSAASTSRQQQKNPVKVSAEAIRLAKIADSDAPKAPKYLSPESVQLLISKRLEMKKKQTELDQLCAFPPHTIRDLEARKRAPTQKELSTLNRVLKVGLSLSH